MIRGKLISELMKGSRLAFTLSVVVTIIASFHLINLGDKQFVDGGETYTHYNNYVIFSNAVEHFWNGQDLYTLYPDEQWDLFKYSPSFALLFTPLHFLPDWLGLTLWNLINTLVLFASIRYLPALSNKQRNLAYALVFIELLTSIQNCQSNGLVAGLIIFAYGHIVRGKQLLAISCLMLTVFIKLFGIVAFAMLLQRGITRRTVLRSLIVALVFIAMPLIGMSTDRYLDQLLSWWHMLFSDHGSSIGYSAMAYVNATLAVSWSKNIVFSIGVVLFLLGMCFGRSKNRTEEGMLMLCSTLLWVVLFNHKAESPTFVIAMSGVALWFVRSEQNWLTIGLICLVAVFTVLSPTEIYPVAHRELFVKPCILKAMPCFYIWLFIILKQFELGGVLPRFEERLLKAPAALYRLIRERDHSFSRPKRKLKPSTQE